MVYAGTGTSVTISNLAPNQRYHVAVIEYTGNTSNVGNINYVAMFHGHVLTTIRI